MLYIVESKKTVQEIEKSFAEVAGRYKFGVLGIHNLRQKMNEKGVPFEKDCLIFEVCNPQQAKKVLDQNMAVSTALPCRVAVYQADGKTRIATLKPTKLLALFEEPALNPVATDVERILLKIMEELA